MKASRVRDHETRRIKEPHQGRVLERFDEVDVRATPEFNEKKSAVNYDLIAHFVGPLGVGALVAGHVRRFVSAQNAMRDWIVAGSYGGTSVTLFLLLLGRGVKELLIGFPIGAAIFMLLHWLNEIDARKQRST